ncbi:unnamed protein product [Linum tenue]|uniref:Uncharacterized protein n=1 Tax=Linum tenue TaxID=586396 RepID=A0AAV0LFK1_9ROSI|nr:unnamed protein product [Linum tenue]
MIQIPVNSLMSYSMWYMYQFSDTRTTPLVHVPLHWCVSSAAVFHMLDVRDEIVQTILMISGRVK